MFHLSDHLKSLLIQSLREKPNSYIVDEIVQRFPTVAELVDATEEELLEIDGVGKIRARQIIATVQQSRIISTPSSNTEYIRSPQDVFTLLGHELKFLQQEHFICIFLNTKNGITGKEVISIGTLNASLVHPREVFRPAIKRSSASIICVHNHPSGNPEPSNEDISITKRLVEAGRIIGIELLDHIIIGHDSFVSLKERGHLS